MNEPPRKPSYDALARRVRELERLIDQRSAAPANAHESGGHGNDAIDFPEPDLAAVIDVKAIQALMDEFHRLTGIGVAILDLQGNVLVATGWQDICTKFHRVHPESRKNCLESDLELANGVAPGGFKRYRCKNNMWDMATPIVVAGRKFGNLYLGQFLFEDESPDVETFRRQARRYGFDEAAYLAALARVPRWSRRTVDTVMHFYARLANLISELGFKNIMLDRNIAEKNRLLDSLGESELKYRELVENLNDVIYSVDAGGRITYVSPSVSAVFGYTADELVGRPYQTLVHPEDREMVSQAFANVIQGKIAPSNYRIRTQTGMVRWVRTSSRPIRKEGRTIGLQGILTDITEHRRTEETLRESEAKFNTAFHAGPVAMSITTLDEGIFLEVNEPFLRLMELDRAAVVGKKAIDLGMWTETDRQALLSELTRHGFVHNKEVELVTRTGRRLPLLWFGDIVQINGKPCIIASGFDLTAQKAAEKALRESEAQHRSILQTAIDGFCMIDAAGRLLEVNDAYCRMTGYTKPELLAMRIWDLEDIETAQQVAARIRKIADAGHDRFESRHRRKDGGLFDVEVSVQYRPGDEGCFIAFVRDITGPKKAAEERRKLQAQLASAMEMAQLGHWEYDVVEDRFIFNDHFYKIFRTTADAVGGHVMSSAEYANRFVHPDDREIVGKEIQKAIETSDPSYAKQLEHRMLYADGAVGHISVRFYIVKDASGRTVKTYGVNQDITERKRLEERVRQIQKMESVGTLAGGIAHDFNNILSPIVGLSELLMDDLEPDNLPHDNAREILKAGLRGRDLVKQILAFSRQAEHRAIPIRLQSVLKEALKLSRATIPSDIELFQDIQKNCGMVMADATQMHQVFMNLVTNAYHAVENTGGSISVRLMEKTLGGDDSQPGALPPGRYALLSVADSGVGIDPKLTGRIFEPYFTTKEQGKGTGLGLAVAYGIVKEHRGDIRVRSAPGVGSTFEVYLPLMKTGPEQAASRDPAACETGTERVLLVDDEDAVIRIETQMLERLGYRVDAFASSAAALEAFEKAPRAFDLVITDMTMPDMTGDRLARRLLEIRPDLPVVICTGFSERISAETAKRMGVAGFLMKPVIKSELARTVRNVLDDRVSRP